MNFVVLTLSFLYWNFPTMTSNFFSSEFRTPFESSVLVESPMMVKFEPNALKNLYFNINLPNFQNYEFDTCHFGGHFGFEGWTSVKIELSLFKTPDFGICLEFFLNFEFYTFSSWAYIRFEYIWIFLEIRIIQSLKSRMGP